MDGIKRMPQAQSYHDTIAVSDTGRVAAETVTLLLNAIQDIGGKDAVRSVALTADLMPYLDDRPQRMVPELDAAALFRATSLHFSPRTCDLIFDRAGSDMASHILQNCMRKGFADLMGLIPKALRPSMLASAIGRQAFCFIPSERFSFRLRPHPQFTLIDSPLQSPGGRWHLALFKSLYLEGTGAEYQWSYRHKQTPDYTVEIFSARRE